MESLIQTAANQLTSVLSPEPPGKRTRRKTASPRRYDSRGTRLRGLNRDGATRRESVTFEQLYITYVTIFPVAAPENAEYGPQKNHLAHSKTGAPGGNPDILGRVFIT